jgi:hypothetical protein
MKSQDEICSFISSSAELNGVAALDWRLFVDERAEQPSDSRSKKRHQGKAKHRSAKLPVIPKVTTVPDEDERDHGD